MYHGRIVRKARLLGVVKYPVIDAAASVVKSCRVEVRELGRLSVTEYFMKSHYIGCCHIPYREPFRLDVHAALPAHPNQVESQLYARQTLRLRDREL